MTKQVPLTPTKEMISAAQVAFHDHFWPGISPTSHTYQGLDVMLAVKLYKAMIEAAPNNPS